MKVIRSFLIVFGGPIVLVSGVIASAVSAVRSISRMRLPGPFAVAGLVSFFVYARSVRPWHTTWGSLPGELDQQLPGDESLNPRGRLVQHAIGIAAPAEAVWPWIAQIGQDRGGFYSYAWLENLAGCEMANAGHIHPDWQRREVGETVKLHPATGLEVSVFEPGRVLGLKDWGNFVVMPRGPESCRLIARGRIRRGFSGVFYTLLVEIPHFVMERKMLLEIKRLAERDHQPGTRPATTSPASQPGAQPPDGG